VIDTCRQSRSRGAVVDRSHIGLLCPQDAVVDGARQGQPLGLLASAVAGAVDLVGGRQPDDCPAAEVGDQQVHLAGAEHLREPGRHRRDRVDRRRRLYLVEELADVDPTGPRSAHGAEPSRAEPAGRSPDAAERQADASRRRGALVLVVATLLDLPMIAAPARPDGRTPQLATA
jgi:hypothetical protein